MRLFLPEEAVEYWKRTIVSLSPSFEMHLCWRGNQRVCIGELNPSIPAFRFRPKHIPFKEAVPSLNSALRNSDESPLPLAAVAGDGQGKGSHDGNLPSPNISPRRDKGRTELSPQTATKALFDPKTSKKKLEDLLGMAFTRAGWLRPRFDPSAVQRILQLRDETSRIEFILETNALSSGVGHFLGELFADRCDLVITDVTCRELRDLCTQANLTKIASDETTIAKRQAYLASQRFLEFSGLPRVLWRRIELEDVALLMSRGPQGGRQDHEKNSESDTAILRVVGRYVRDHVPGLKRFFVNSDTDAVRQASMDLPQGSVLAARTIDLQADSTYFPCRFWPGPDEGSALCSASPIRLFWEILALADFIELLPIRPNTPGLRVRAFCEEMWPSDYREPWLDVTEISASEVFLHSQALRPVAPVYEPQPTVSGSEKVSAQSDTKKDVHIQALPPPTPDLSLLQIYQPSPPVELPQQLNIETNLRISATLFLDILSTLSLSNSESAEPLRVPASYVQVVDADRRRHMQILCESLSLAKFQQEGKKLIPLPGSKLLRIFWSSNDIDGIALLLRPYKAFAEQIENVSPAASSRPQTTQDSARSLAALLGQVVHLRGYWYGGSENPTFQKVRDVIVAYLEKERRIDRTYTIYELLTEVFLKELKVSPVRAIAAWQRMLDTGVFAGLEFRGGGTSSGRRYQEVAAFSRNGWHKERIDIEEVYGKRDLVDRRLGAVGGQS